MKKPPRISVALRYTGDLRTPEAIKSYTKRVNAALESKRPASKILQFLRHK